IMQTPSFPIYLAGEFVTSEQNIDVINPYDKSLIAQTWLASSNQINQAIDKALAVKTQLANLPSYKRYEILMFIAAEIKKQKEEFALLLSREAGKPLKYALAEIDRSIQTFTIAAEES
ncbi:MAG: aldehyde dehydrogenase family protein, partial [Bacteroidia bacterium]